MGFGVMSDSVRVEAQGKQRDYRHYCERFFRKGKYFAFYVDLLGQKDLYADFQSDIGNRSFQIGLRLKQVVYVTEKVLSYVQMVMFKIANGTQFLYDRLIALRYKKFERMTRNEFADKIKSLQFGTQQYSDSLIFYLRDDSDIAADVFPICVTLLSRLAMEYFPNRVAFRGSIAYNDGWEAGFDTVDGPILKEIEELESKDAQYPRIVVSSKLYDYCMRANKSSDGSIHGIENYSAGLLPIFKRDVDGNYYLDLWNDSYRRGLDNAEKDLHRDLLISSCKFLYDEYRLRCKCAQQASTAADASKQASIANKYLLAYEKLDVKIPQWTDANINFDRPLSEYAPSLENYRHTEIKIDGYTVVRLTFTASDSQDIEQSRIVDRGVRAIEKTLAWLRRNAHQLRQVASRIMGFPPNYSIKEIGGMIFQDIVIQRIANVVVIAFKQQIMTSEYLMMLYLLLSKLITRLMGHGVLVSGSTVHGLGWLVQNSVLCGPVMQRSYEYQAKLANSYRLVFDSAVAEGFRQAITNIKKNNPNTALTHPNLDDCVIQDFDGVDAFDYLGIYECISQLSSKSVSRYNSDLNILKLSFCKMIDDATDSRRLFKLYGSARYIDKFEFLQNKSSLLKDSKNGTAPAANLKDGVK